MSHTLKQVDGQVTAALLALIKDGEGKSYEDGDSFMAKSNSLHQKYEPWMMERVSKLKNKLKKIDEEVTVLWVRQMSYVSKFTSIYLLDQIGQRTLRFRLRWRRRWYHGSGKSHLTASFSSLRLDNER